jgi:hypothetical protein
MTMNKDEILTSLKDLHNEREHCKEELSSSDELKATWMSTMANTTSALKSLPLSENRWVASEFKKWAK